MPFPEALVIIRHARTPPEFGLNIICFFSICFSDYICYVLSINRATFYSIWYRYFLWHTTFLSLNRFYISSWFILWYILTLFFFLQLFLALHFLLNFEHFINSLRICILCIQSECFQCPAHLQAHMWRDGHWSLKHSVSIK